MFIKKTRLFDYVPIFTVCVRVETIIGLDDQKPLLAQYSVGNRLNVKCENSPSNPFLIGFSICRLFSCLLEGTEENAKATLAELDFADLDTLKVRGEQDHCNENAYFVEVSFFRDTALAKTSAYYAAANDCPIAFIKQYKDLDSQIRKCCVTKVTHVSKDTTKVTNMAIAVK